MVLLSQYSLYELIIFGTLLFTLAYQIVTWLIFSAVAAHRHTTRLAADQAPPAVSVIIVMNEGSEWFLEGGLQQVLDQKYDGSWEVVVVNDCGGVELSSSLAMIALERPMLRHTELKVDQRFIHSRKIPLLVGIKAAQYPNVLIADPSAVPSSDKWLSIMARGFVGGSVVIGYTGFVAGTNAFIRSARFYTSLRYLRSAVMGRAYRGIFNNIGYTKETFFASRGYTHLRLALGEDDLFIQKISAKRDVSVMLNPHATMRQSPYGGLGWWFSEERYRSFAFRFYPLRVRMGMFFEMSFRTLFFAAVVCLSLLPYPYIWAYGAGAFLIREIVTLRGARRVLRRLGERRLLFVFLLYDIVEPVYATILSLSRRIKKPNGVWR